VGTTDEQSGNAGSHTCGQEKQKVKQAAKVSH